MGNDMDTEALRGLLAEQVDSIFAFMDYEVVCDDADLASTLDAWLGSARWKESGHRFVHLGIDGSGGQFAAWIRPGAEEPHPVVFFGSEGGRGVLAASPGAWAKMLASWITVNEYDYSGPDEDDSPHDRPSTVSARGVYDHDDPDDIARAKAALAGYRTAVEAKLGATPSLERLQEGASELNPEFLAWVEQHVDH
jgi:hypothetical protein